MILTQLPSAAETLIGSVTEGLLVPQQTNLETYVAGLITSEEGSGAKIAQDAIDSKDDSTIAHFLRDAPWTGRPSRLVSGRNLSFVQSALARRDILPGC